MLLLALSQIRLFYTNRLVMYVCNCSLFGSSSLELFISSLAILPYYPLCPVCSYGHLPDSNKWLTDNKIENNPAKFYPDRI